MPCRASLLDGIYFRTTHSQCRWSRANNSHLSSVVYSNSFHIIQRYQFFQQKKITFVSGWNCYDIGAVHACLQFFLMDIWLQYIQSALSACGTIHSFTLYYFWHLINNREIRKWRQGCANSHYEIIHWLVWAIYENFTNLNQAEQ